MSNFDPKYYQRNPGLKIILEEFGYQNKMTKNYGKSYNFFNSHKVRNGAYDQNTKNFYRLNEYKKQKQNSLEALYKDLGYRPKFRYQQEFQKDNHRKPTKYQIQYSPHSEHHQDSCFQFQHQNPSQ